MKILVITSWLTDILEENGEKGKELREKYPALRYAGVECIRLLRRTSAGRT
jgi:hypothetical protein